MKKLIVIFSAAFVFFSLAACGRSNNKTGTATTSNPSENGVVGDVIDDIEDDVLGAEDAIKSATDDLFNDDDDITGDEKKDSIMANDDIAADNNVSSATNQTESSGRKRMNNPLSSDKEGELYRLASLVGKDESVVASVLGNGKIKENAAIKEFDITLFGSRERAEIYYSGRKKVKKITISPEHKGLVGTLLAVTKEFGEPDKISSDGLSYDYLAVWKTENAEITLLKWHDVITLTIE